MKSFRSAILVTSTCALACIQPLRAQESAESDERTTGAVLEQIVVSARRVEENLQRVPIAVTVVSEDLLDRRDVRTFEDVALNTPALTMFGGRGANAPTVSNIRGVPGVVGYFADVPADLQGSGLLFDVANVQVLKGPQGTLFGIATNGGAILVQPKLPSNQVEGYGEITMGTYGRRIAEGALNIPIFDDKLQVRAAFIVAHTDGIGRRLDTGERLGDENYWAARLSAIVRPTENLENYTLVNYSRSHSTSYPNVLRAVDPNGLVARIYGADALATILRRQQALGVYKVAEFNGPSGPNRGESLNVVNTTTYNINEKIALKNIFGYQRANFLVHVDGDGTIFPISGTDSRTQTPADTPTWSDEVQLVGTDLWDRLDVQIGTFHTASHSDSNIAFGNSFGSVSATINKTSSQTRAVYGQVNYDLSDAVDGLSFTAGYRYTWDRRTQENHRLNVATLQSNRDLRGAAEFSSGSYTLGLQYQFTPDVMVFVTNSEGYSAGGLTLTAPPPFNVFQPESLNNLEVGIKSQFEVGPVQARANVSYFYGWYRDKQTTQAILAQLNPPPAPRGILSTTTNAGSANPRGFDADLTVIPTENLELSVGVSYSIAEYSRFDTLDSQGNPVSKAGQPFVATSKWKYHPHITYHLPIGDAMGDVSVSLDYTWYDKVQVDSAAIVPDRTPYHGFRPPREFLDASLRWENVLGYDGFDLSVYGTNLTEETGTVNGLGGWSLIGMSADAPAEPRMFGVRMHYSF